MASLLQDVRYGARLLARTPAHTAIAVLALTLGIGLTTAMFSIVYGVLLRGLPFPESERIMALVRTNPAIGVERASIPYHDLLDLREQQRGFEDLAGFYTGTVNLRGTDRPHRLAGAFITANTFRLLRVQPVLGRDFRDGEDRPGAEPVAILSHMVWRDHFRSDPGVLGQTVWANGEPMTVIGVMPEKFQFPVQQEIWLPLRMDPLALARGDGIYLTVFGRLRPGVGVDPAASELNAIARRLAVEHPQTNEGWGVAVHEFVRQYIGDEPVKLLYTMLGAVFLVLLVACANVANLLLGKALLRGREVGIRAALGASRPRLMAQFLTETLVVSSIGALLGTGVAWAGVAMFNRAIAAERPPYWIDIRIDPVALLFAAGVAVLAAVVAGVLPALQASRADVSDVLKDESRGSSSFRMGRAARGLVVLEIALSCGLLIGAGLMVKSVASLNRIDFGFAREDVFTARIGLFETEYPTAESRAQLFERVRERIAEIGDVRVVALTSNLPGLGSGRIPFAVEGQAYATDSDHPRGRMITATPGLFDAVGVGLLQGRDFDARDRDGSLPVAIVNTRFAERYFPGQDPVGRRIRVGDSRSEAPWLTVVGVAPDLFHAGVEQENPEAFYVPVAQNAGRFMSIVARARGNPAALANPVREAVLAADPDLPIYFVETLDAAIRQSSWPFRVFGTIFMIFGFVALFLATVGLYGVMAFAVSRRTREVGIRMALGARSADVIRMILRQGAWQLGIGIALGLALAAGVSHLLTIVLFQVNPRDPLIFGTITAVLAAAGLAACLLPARRASAVDPLVALRVE